MNANKHDVESEGSNPRDHAHPRKKFQWKHAHRDWRVWVVAIVLLVLMLVYVVTDNLLLRPGTRAIQQTPSTHVP
jgi:hypothetical protein